MGVRAYNTRVLVDEFDFSGDTKSVKVAYTVKAMERNSLQSSAARAVPGSPNGVISLAGYWEGPGVGTISQEIDDRLGTEDACIVSCLFDTTAVGNPGYVLATAWANQMEIDSPVEDLIKLNSEWAGVMRRGLFVADSLIDATGGQTTIDFGAAGPDGGWATIHVTAIDGDVDGATFTIQSSSASNFSSPTTHATLTVDAVGSQTTDWTSAMGRYVRINCTDLGGATSLTISAIVGMPGITGR